MAPVRIQTQVMVVRRPSGPGVTAFGHIDVAPGGRSRLHTIVSQQVADLGPKLEVEFHPDDLAEDNEVLVADLHGFDSWFQPQAPWSLERAVREIRAPRVPATLTASGIASGDWGFYLIRSRVSGKDAIVLRAKSPTWGLKSEHKLIAMFVGDELKPIEGPLISFDHTADLVVIEDDVYVLEPRRVERLLIDADAVKARAPEITQSLETKLPISLATETVAAIERVCSHNANVARRVERLVRDAGLSRVTASGVRAALPDAGLPRTAFGSSGPLKIRNDEQAVILIDIVADLYYQPRFATPSRRVAAYRLVR